MFKWLLLLLLLATPAWAQNPTCPTRPVGDDTNACASTAFVQQNAGGAGSLTITDGTHTVTPTTQLTITGGTVGGTTPNATLTISGGGSSTITEGSTATSGFTNNNLLTSNSSTVGQVSPTVTVNGTPCTLGSACSPAGLGGITNASGSTENTTGTIGSSSTALTLTAAKDFVNAEGIRVNHAGAAFTLNAPTAGAVTPNGTTGSTTYQYKLASIDAHGGVGAATSAIQTTTGNATLSFTNYNAITFTAATGTAPVGYAVYKDISGTYTLIGVTDNSLTFNDYGYTGFPYLDWLPTAAPATALADALVTTISSGGGTTSITLGNASTTAATSQGVYHDDGAAIQTALTANTSVIFPAGTFLVASTGGLNAASSSYIAGQGSATILQSVYVGGTLLNLGSYDRLSNITEQLVPGAIGVAVVGGNEYDNIDHMWCQGGATGAYGVPVCVLLKGVAYQNISHTTSNGWLAASLGFGGAGEVPVIYVTNDTGTGNSFTLQAYFDNITMSNDGGASGGQPQAEQEYMTFEHCLNCGVTNSYLNAGSENTYGLGGGILMEGNSEVLNVVNNQILGFSQDVTSYTDGTNTPLTLNVIGNHFDFCGSICVYLGAGSWATVQANSFAGEGGAPNNFNGNAAIRDETGFGGPTVISGNTIIGFSGSGSVGIQADSNNNTTIGTNQFASNTTNISGSLGSNSALGQNCSGSPSSSFSSFNGVVGHC
jgi:hypothetical protein